MKKAVLFSIVSLFIFDSVQSQINMNCDAEVGIGTSAISGIDLTTPKAKITNLGINASPMSNVDFYALEAKINSLGVNTNPSASYDLYVAGDCKFQGYYTSYYLYFEYGGSSETVIRPSANNKGTVGTSSYAIRKMYAYDFDDVSDKRQKENIQNLTGSLDKVLGLQGVKYDLKREFAYDESLIKDSDELAFFENDRKNNIGFLAQDVKEVLPEVVSYDDSTDVYTMNYGRIVPVLVEAIKEQQAIIESLVNQVNGLQNESPILKGSSIGTSVGTDNMYITNTLFQNQPNPFREETKINFFLSDNIGAGIIYVYDMTGAQLKSIELNQRGNGVITIKGGEFSAGMYLYSLVVNGQVIDTKQMILTE